jgi:hypothetical protein
MAAGEDQRDGPTTVRRKRIVGQTKDVIGKAEKLTENSKERLEKSQTAIDESIERLTRRG